MTTTDIPRIEASIDIAAPTEAVWALVSDLGRMAEWSPQVVSVRPKGEPGLGMRFTNLNRAGELEWVTHGEVVRFEPGAEIAFRIEENWTVWSFSLFPEADATRLVQRRATPEGLSPLSREFTDAYLGGQERFRATMRDGMAATLASIKATAEDGRVTG